MYDAFISYSRTADGKLGPAVQRGLQRFAKPWYRLRALRVFRDDASLSANPDLWASIEQALDGSEYFILLASPAAAQSQWVAKEAEHWLERRGTERMLVVLTDGELFWDADTGEDRARSTALPAAVGAAFAEEPRYVDLRWARNDGQLAQRDLRFRDALADLAAPLHGRSKDEMLGEDVRQHKRTLRIAWSAAALLAALAAGASVLAVLAVQARDRARTQANIAMSRQLAAESAAQLDGPGALSPLLALEAYRRVRRQPAERSYDARNAMQTALQSNPRLLATLPASGLRAAAFSPDGKAIATGSDGGRVQFWNARDGQALGPPQTASRVAVRAMAYGEDGKTVAVGDEKGRVTFWDAARQRASGAIAGATRYITLIAFSPDGSHVAVIGADEDFGADRVRLWDTRNLQRPPRLLGEDEANIVDAAFTRGGNGLITTNDLADVKFWPVRGATRHPIDADGYSLTTALDGRVLLLAKTTGGGARIVDALRGKLRGPRVPVAGEFFFSVAPGGHTFSSGALGSFDLWNVRGSKVVHETLPARQGGFATPLFSRDGTELASVGMDGTVKLWDARDEDPLSQVLRPVPRSAASASSASAVALGPGGAAAAADESSVTFWADSHSPGVRRPSTWGAASLAFSPDGTRLASADSDGDMTLWDTARHRQLVSRPSPRHSVVWALAFSPDGKEVTSRSADGVVAWSVSDGRPAVRSGAKVVLPPRCPGSDPTGKYGSCPDAPTRFAVTRDGTLVYTTLSVAVRFWDPEDRRSLGELRTRAIDVALAPDGFTLATAGSGAVRLWDLGRRQPLGRPLRSPVGVDSVAFSSDGMQLAAGGDHGTVTIWDRILLSSDFDAWRTRLCRLAGRNLTRSEWARFLTGEPYRRSCPGLP